MSSVVTEAAGNKDPSFIEIKHVLHHVLSPYENVLLCLCMNPLLGIYVRMSADFKTLIFKVL